MTPLSFKCQECIHKRIWEGEPVNNKETNWLPTSTCLKHCLRQVEVGNQLVSLFIDRFAFSYPFVNAFLSCLVVVAWYLCHTIWLIWQYRHSQVIIVVADGLVGWFNIKMPSYQYRKSHCGDKIFVRSCDLHNGISYTGKITSLYWIEALVPIWHQAIYNHHDDVAQLANIRSV